LPLRAISARDAKNIFQTFRGPQALGHAAQPLHEARPTATDKRSDPGTQIASTLFVASSAAGPLVCRPTATRVPQRFASVAALVVGLLLGVLASVAGVAAEAQA
jgi:hypothetical protein